MSGDAQEQELGPLRLKLGKNCADALLFFSAQQKLQPVVALAI